MTSSIPAAQLLRLESPPRVGKYETHIWADYIELLCLANEDREFSKADALDRIRERINDLGEGAEDLLPSAESSPAEENDKWSELVDVWFEHLQYRKRAFEAFYPFSFSPDGEALIAEGPLTLGHKFYIFLLLSSNLRHVEKPVETPLTSNFEFLSSEAMRKLLPEQAEVHLFRANSEHTSKYQGNLLNRIRALAKDLREQVKISGAAHSPYNVGDKGLDVVGWVPFDDSAPGLPILFAQCACTPQWVQKQYSSSFSAWNTTMSFVCPPANIAFIPYCFRSSEGRWHKEGSDISFTLIIDRQRLIYLLHDHLVEHFEPLRSRQIVEEILQQSEPLF